MEKFSNRLNKIKNRRTSILDTIKSGASNTLNSIKSSYTKITKEELPIAIKLQKQEWEMTKRGAVNAKNVLKKGPGMIMKVFKNK